MKNKIETWCPKFPGFYNSIFEFDDANAEYTLFNDPSSVEKKYPAIFEFVTERLSDYIDYQTYRDDVSKSFVEVVERICKENSLPVTKIKFQHLASPKYYNYSNDSINIEVVCDWKKLVEMFKNNENAEQYIKDTYTSYSGFSSSYPNTLEEWSADLMSKDCNRVHKLGAMLDCLLTPLLNSNEWEDFYYEVMENISNFEYIEYDKLIEAINDQFYEVTNGVDKLDEPIKHLSDLEDESKEDTKQLLLDFDKMGE